MLERGLDINMPDIFSVVIENCIICDGAEVKKGSVLKSCLIGPSFVVAEGSTHEKQHLGESNEFMNIE